MNGVRVAQHELCSCLCRSQKRYEKETENGERRMEPHILSMDFGRYDVCWFEIRTNDRSIVTRDREKFLKKSETISRLEEVRLYRIEKSVSGMKKSRIHNI